MTPLAVFGAGSMMTALVVVELAVLGVVFVCDSPGRASRTPRTGRGDGFGV